MSSTASEQGYERLDQASRSFCRSTWVAQDDMLQQKMLSSRCDIAIVADTTLWNSTLICIHKRSSSAGLVSWIIHAVCVRACDHMCFWFLGFQNVCKHSGSRREGGWEKKMGGSLAGDESSERVPCQPASKVSQHIKSCRVVTTLHPPHHSSPCNPLTQTISSRNLL